MTSSSAGRKRSLVDRRRGGGTRSGTLTRAKRRSPVSGSPTIAATLQREVGDVRERVAGVDGQRREHREDALLVDLGHRACGRRRRGRSSRTIAMPGVGERRHAAASRNTASWRATSSRGALGDRRRAAGPACARPASAPRCRRRPGPSARRRGPGRTRRGWSSVIAQNLARSSSGMPGSVASCEHAVVEVEPAQLAVDEPVVHHAPLDRSRTRVRAIRRPRRRRRRSRHSSSGRRGPTRARSARARRRGRRARGCGGTAGRRAAAARGGRAPGRGTPRARCGRPSRRRPPSAATPGRGRRCGRGPGAAVGDDVTHARRGYRCARPRSAPACAPTVRRLRPLRARHVRSVMSSP